MAASLQPKSIVSMASKDSQVLGCTELTVEDLEESDSLKGKAAISTLKPEEITAQSANYGEQSVSTISILKKKPPSSPSVSAQFSSDKKVSFAKESVPTAVPVFKSENEGKMHKDCPCCTCHLKDSSLKAVSMLQSIPERSATSAMELSSLQYRSRACVSNSAGFVPLGQRSENSPSQVFRARLNQRLIKQASKIESFQVPDPNSLHLSPFL